MNILGIIPARYHSTRFPGKPLTNIHGKTMLQRVYEQAKKSKALSEIIIATDHDEIFKHAQSFGGKVMLTDTAHRSGTERCAEVVRKINEDFEVIINIQGDEPFIQPMQIDLLAECFLSPLLRGGVGGGAVQIATLIKLIDKPDELYSNNVVKAVVNKNNNAIYFSRLSIPYFREKPLNEWLKHHSYYKHIGIYGYRKKTLLEIVALSPTPLEKAESLEQLRWLENDYKIKTAITDFDSIAIDTPEDLFKL